MSAYWERVAESSIYTTAELEQAAYALMVQQALYMSEPRQKVAYTIVRMHLTAFRNLFNAFGVDIVEEPADAYVAAVPRGQRGAPLTREMTLVVLTAAQIYHQQMTRGEVVDDSRAIVTIDEFRSAYRALAGKDLPDEVGPLKQLLQQTQRMGMTRMVETDNSSPQPFDIAVLPAIKTLVAESTLMRFAASYQAVNDKDANSDADADDATEGDSNEAA